MKLTGVELRRVSMPLVSPFRTSFGTQTARELMLLRIVTDEAEGWGECVAMSDPLYSSEYVDAAADVLRRFLVPALAASGPLDAHSVAHVLEPFKGHRMAKAALEMGVLDAELRSQGRSFARELGAVHERVPCGVSEIAWTFDPLVSRNAYFNLIKLGADAVEYLPNFYGPMLDTINGDDDSDRLLIKWRLLDPGELHESLLTMYQPARS